MITIRVSIPSPKRVAATDAESASIHSAREKGNITEGFCQLKRKYYFTLFKVSSPDRPHFYADLYFFASLHHKQAVENTETNCLILLPF